MFTGNYGVTPEGNCFNHQAGKADLVTMARASLADPDMPLKAREGRFDEIVKCVACNEGCTKNRGENTTVTCSVNPSIGNEWKSN